MPLGGGGGGREAEHMVSTVHLTTNSLSNTGTDREHCGQMELYRRIWNDPAAENTTHTHSGLIRERGIDGHLRTTHQYKALGVGGEKQTNI